MDAMAEAAVRQLTTDFTERVEHEVMEDLISQFKDTMELYVKAKVRELLGNMEFNNIHNIRSIRPAIYVKFKGESDYEQINK
jgi:hypothetical protein